MWLGLHDALPTETFRFKRHLASSDMCKRCNKAQETMEHCLRDCERSKAIWYMLDPSILDSTTGTALEEWFRKALANNEASFGAGLWWVWRHRCNDIFNTDNPWTDHKVVALARITAKDLQVYRNRSNAFRSLRNCLCWEPPVGNSFKVNCDASLYMDSNLAGFGCIIRDSKGDWISGCSGSIPPWSIIRCELFAAWRGLVLAWDCGLRNIICETDCLDILPIMHELTSGYPCEVTDLVHKIQELLSRPWLVHVEWVSREANRAADWMAKYGAKSNSNHVIWSEPGVDFQRIICLDLG